MIPHRPPPGIPVHLLEPQDRAACADYGGNEWQKACADAASVALTETGLDTRYGLTHEAINHKPRELRPRGLGDDRLGREALTELAKRQRGR